MVSQAADWESFTSLELISMKTLDALPLQVLEGHFLLVLVPQCNNLVDNITQNYIIILHSYLVQECLGHLELWTEFGDRRLDGERGRVRIVEGGGEHPGAEVEAEGIVR